MTAPTLPRPATDSSDGPPSGTAATQRTASAGLLHRLWRGRPGDPAWVRAALLALLATTALLYLWDLGSSGWANSYYAAAVQAGTQSWTSLLFGSLDAGNAITVDKTPASLWVMALSGRAFGFSSWSMLAPQALEGVAAVAILYAGVRRVSGPAAGLVAGAGLALTPVATLMFRFNNPDALLTLLLVGAAYCTVRALEVAERRSGTRWLMLAGACVGFGFLTKMLQAFLVLPALAITFALFAAGPVGRRIGQLLAAAATVVISAGWWIALVQLWPASARPYIGGSTNNSVLELALGYNGLSRILGNTGGGPGGAPGGGAGSGPGGANVGFGGSAGWLRMFGDSFGTEVSWLLPAALIGLLAALWTARRAPRADLVRAGLVLWGLWLVVTATVFSFMSGTVHPYYAIALAPSVAALVAIAGRELWHARGGAGRGGDRSGADRWVARGALGAMVAAAGVWSIALLARTPDWHPELRYALVPLTMLATVAVLVAGSTRLHTRMAALAVVLALVTGLGGGAAYSVATASMPHSGSLPTSGPSASATGGPGAGATSQVPDRSAGQLPGQLPGQMPGRDQGAPSAGGALVALLQQSTTRWAAATVGAQSAAGLELASGASVIGIGGFTNSDPAPTLAQFQQYVAAGEVHYFVVAGGAGGAGGGAGGGPGGGPGESGTGSAIQSWVEANFTATTVGGSTVYDLTAPTA